MVTAVSLQSDNLYSAFGSTVPLSTYVPTTSDIVSSMTSPATLIPLLANSCPTSFFTLSNMPFSMMSSNAPFPKMLTPLNIISVPTSTIAFAFPIFTASFSSAPLFKASCVDSPLALSPITPKLIAGSPVAILAAILGAIFPTTCPTFPAV